MSDETGQATGAVPPDEPTQPSADASAASAAWREVVGELDALGDAIGRWAKAAVNDPENKRRADELKGTFEKFAAQAGVALKGATDSDVGQSFKAAAEKTGEAFREAGERISEEAGPKIASAFRTLSERFKETAQRMEDRADDRAAGAPTAGEEPSETPPEGDQRPTG